MRSRVPPRVRLGAWAQRRPCRPRRDAFRQVCWMSSRFLMGFLSAFVQPRFFQPSRHLDTTLIAYCESARMCSSSPVSAVASSRRRIAVSSPRLLVPFGQPPASHVSSSTYHAHPAGPGLPREEPSAAAVIVMLSSYRHRACLIGTGDEAGARCRCIAR